MAASDSSSRALFCSPSTAPPKRIRCARLLTVLVTGQCKVGGGDAFQNALSMGDDRLALLQGLFLAGLQRSGVNGIDLGGQGFYAALLVGLAGVCGIQLALLP